MARSTNFGLRIADCGLLVLLAFCFTAPGWAQDLAGVGTGETKLEGTVTAVDLEAERLVMDVQTLTSYTGDKQQLKVPESKVVTFSKYTQFSIADPQSISKADLKVGIPIHAVGRDDGTGKLVSARIILLPVLEHEATLELQRITVSGGTPTGRVAFTAFRGGNYDIYTIDDNGENLQRLTTDRGKDTLPALSPDGSRIAFVSDRDGNDEIYIMNVDGSHQVRLTKNSALDSRPSFSSDGQKIIFTSRNNLEGRGRPYTMNLDGSELTAVNLGGDWSGGSEPALGGVDDKIVYSNGAVFLASGGGSEIKRVVASGYGARLSPDGGKIVYVRAANPGERMVNYEIYLVNVEGGEEVRLTDSPGTDQDPAFSPDGKQVVFYSSRRDGRQLYIVNADGSNLRRLTSTPGHNRNPSWGRFYTGAMPPAITPKISASAANEPPVQGPPEEEVVAPKPPEKAIEGKWQVVEDKDQGDGKWTISDDRILLSLPAGSTQGQTYKIESQEVLLHGGNWILDFTLVYHGDNWPQSVALEIGDSNPDSNPNSQGGSLRLQLSPERQRSGGNIALRKPRGGLGVLSIGAEAGGGPVQMVRVAYNRNKNSLQFFINGQPLIFWRHDVEFLLPFPVRFVVRTTNAKEASAVELVSFRLTKDAETELPSQPGLALAGWKNSPTTPLPAGVAATTKKYLPHADLPPLEKAYALAILVLSEKSTTGKIGDASWKAITDFVTAQYQKPQETQNPDALSVLLPIAVASADDRQREEAKVWSRRFFEAWVNKKPGPFPAVGDEFNPIMLRASLLDPSLTAVSVLPLNPSLRLAQTLASDLKEKDPQRALAIYLALMSGDSYRAQAWLLPEVRDFAPEYYKLRFELFKAAMEREKFFAGEPDRSYSMMAYRLAPTDMATAMELWEKIKKPEIKAEALEYITAVAPPGKSGEFDAKIEANLKAAIDAWKPSARNDSAVPETIRLARWYFGRGRKSEATQVINVMAIPKIGALSSTRFRDSWAIARLLLEMKSPAADEWLKKAQQAATALDKERDEPDMMGSTVYFAATSLVVPELLKQGRIDEALAMTQQLDPDLLTMNFSNNMARIVSAVADKDFARALKLLELIPEGRRSGVYINLAVKRARTDLPAALVMLETQPLPTRSGALFRIAEFASLEKNPALIKLLGESLAAKLAARRGQRMATDYALIDQLSKLQLPTLLALEPYFEDGRLYFLRPLLLTSGRAAGLQADELWQRIAAAQKQPYGTSIPWGVDKLEYAARAEKANAERDNDE